MPQGQRTLTEVDGVVEIGPDTLGLWRSAQTLSTAASSRGWPMGRAGAATEVDTTSRQGAVLRMWMRGASSSGPGG
jgi:hypothetical protein